MTKMVFAQAEDWLGVYIDGKLVRENHNFEPFEMVQVALVRKVDEVEHKWVNAKWMDDMGSMPKNLSEVVWEGEIYEMDQEEEISEVVKNLLYG